MGSEDTGPTSKQSDGTPIVWMDLEMTGLDPDADEIIEIATLVTDADLNITARGPELVLNQPESRFEKMDDWNREHHTKSGLWKSVIASDISMADAEEQTLAFLKEHTKENTSPLAGNSVWQDRRFLIKHMPKLDEWLHYRLIDVSTIKELSGRWYPPSDATTFIKKKNSHRAMDDIVESIEELRFYKQAFFRDTPTAPAKSES